MRTVSVSLDRLYNGRRVAILDKQVDYFSYCFISFNLCCNDAEHFEDISNRSQTSAPDKPTAAEYSD